MFCAPIDARCTETYGKNIYSQMWGISEFIRVIYNRYLQLEVVELREEVSMTDMLNDKMYSFQKNTEVTIKHAPYFPACDL